ncbi:MAG: glycosyltransferase [Planctomycetaceae bacterium]|nr:glycosyltransferase [Planctomycetaceae bacterium]
MTRVALLFDNTPRPETTGFYVRRALGQVANVEHFVPSEFDQLARGEHGPFDLLLAIDDGLDYDLPSTSAPLAFWAIDTHVGFERILAKARQSRFVFAAQRNGAERLRHEGIDSAAWLPLACDPEFHRPHPVSKQFDVAFVGNLLPGSRTELLEQVERRYPYTFIGRRYGHAMAEAFSAARVVFNRSVRDDVNMRVFEAASSGSLLVTNDLAGNGQEELLEHGRHCLTYRDAGELWERIDWALSHERDRERIAAAGRARALERHTYRHRVETILETVERGQRTAVPFPASPSSKDTSYFEFARPEVLALIPESARNVLEIGCGAGRLGSSLKARQPARVTGIELDPRAAAVAKDRLDDVLCRNAEDPDLEFPDGTFDCVVCADFLEHLREPGQLLARIRRWLTPDGMLVASLPNVQHHSVVTSLLAGNFTYETAGLLDATHLRFFTRREIEKLLYRAGFESTLLQSIPGPCDGDWWQSPTPEVRIGSLHMTGVDPDRAREFFTYQYLVTARPAPARNDGLTSIILVTHNQLDYTRHCLDSIRRFTDEPYELIVVDNGSTDGTPGFLRGSSDIRLIENADTRGFPAAVNQGLAVACGAQILLLNNDTVVTTGWLRRMLDGLRSDEQVGLVGPVSNSVSGPQQIPVAYTQLHDLDGFAWDWGRSHHRQISDLDRLVGFCLLIDRKVIDAIGGLDERFGIGNFEDDDYCRRARKAGFRTIVALDSFVHHFGGRTFAASGIDFNGLMAQNQRLYEEKWSADRTPVASRRSSADMGSAATLPQPHRPRLSLCMIVRDNERTIRPCLESIRPWVDEMIVVDTGSTDRTPEICRELGARVFHFPWCDDFSAARNRSLSYAGGEWIFWMDSDDTIPEACGRQLRALADGEHSDHVLGYVMQVHCPAPNSEGTHDVTVVDHVKLFRNRSDLRFEHRIHEQILPAIRRAGGEVEFTDIHVIHSGSDHTSEGRARKLDRDFRLLKLDADERPDHPFVLFNLGMTYADAGRHDEAIAALEQCLAVSTPGESHLRKAYTLLVASLAHVSDFSAADRRCKEGLEHFADDPELLFRQALLHHERGDLRAAEQTYLKLLGGAIPASRTFQSRDVAIGGWKARHNLALVHEEMGDITAAVEDWKALLDDHPHRRAVVRALGNLLLRAGWHDQLSAWIAEWETEPKCRGEAWLLKAQVVSQADRLEEALGWIDRAERDSPAELEPLRLRCRILFEAQRWPEAEDALKQLAARDATDGATLHNLATVYRTQGRDTLAIAAYQASLQVRPASVPTLIELGHALLESGDTSAAAATWKEAVRLGPDHPRHTEVRQALQTLGGTSA